MGQFIQFPDSLLDCVLQSGQLLKVSEQTIAYIFKIEQVCKLIRSYQLVAPAFLKDALPSRLEEFFSGRVVAEAILRHHFASKAMISSKSQHLPQWPHTYLGSISHNQQQLLVMVSAEYSYVGVDLKEHISQQTAEQIADLILTRKEQQYWLQEVKQYISYTQYVSLLFSMKESLYKAVYPIAMNYIDFLEVEMIEVNMNQRRAHFQFCTNIQKKYALSSDYLVQWLDLNDWGFTFVLQGKK